MAFFGVFIVSGLIAAIVWAMLCMAVGGAALLIAALVLLRLFRKGRKAWMKIAGIVCAVVGGVSLLTAAVIYLLMRSA